MTTRTVALLVACASTWAISTVAFAEPAPAPAGASDETGIEEIIVTAQKRTENLESVPVAISAFTSKERDLLGLESITDMTNVTPGLAYSTYQDRAFIRGVGRETNDLATQPGVATYADGLYNTSVVAASGDSMFIDRVEVLRGPQGTLYGRNSIGGTIDSISKRPTTDWTAEVRANVGNYGVHNFEGALSGPISDTMRFRFAGYKNDQTDGYYNNLATGNSYGGSGNSFYWEGQFEWDISPDVEFWLKFDQLGYNRAYLYQNVVGPYDTALLTPGFPLFPTPGFGTTPGATGLTPANAIGTNPANQDIRNYSNNDTNNAHLSRTYQVTPQLTWHTPWASDLKYIGGYTTYYFDLWQDYDNTNIGSYQIPASEGAPGTPPLTVYPSLASNYIENKKYYSNEFNLTSHTDSSVQWIVGLYQYHEQFDQPIQVVAPTQGNANQGANCVTYPAFTPGVGCLDTPYNLTLTGLAAPNPGAIVHATRAQMDGYSYAAFEQIDWKFLPTWKFTSGLRFTYDSLAGVASTRVVCLGCVLPQVLGAFSPALDVTETTIAAGNYRGTTSAPYYNPVNGFWARGLADHWDALTGVMELDWTPNDNTLAYGKYTRGYKSGGFNTQSITPDPESDPEHIDAYELGAKIVFNKQLQVNTALYFYNYENLQLPVDVVPGGTASTYTTIVNIPKVVSYGAEFETIYQPIANLQFRLDYAYMDATIRSNFNFTNPVNGVYTDTLGQTVPQAPRNKVAGNGNYTWHFTPGSLNFSATYIWKAKTYDSIFNEPYNLAPSYSEVDSRLSWNDAADRYTVFIYGKNLQNKTGYVNSSAFAIGDPAGGYDQILELTPPRTYGIEVQYRLK
jgi:iron complex outermembrane recepter protein